MSDPKDKAEGPPPGSTIVEIRKGGPQEWKRGILKITPQNATAISESYGSLDEADAALKNYEAQAREKGYIVMKDGSKVQAPFQLSTGQISVTLADHP